LSNLTVGRLAGLQHSSVIIYLAVISLVHRRRENLRKSVIILSVKAHLLYGLMASFPSEFASVPPPDIINLNVDRKGNKNEEVAVGSLFDVVKALMSSG